MKQMSDIMWVVCNELTTVWAPTKKLLVSWQFSGPYGVTKYDSGWRKYVVNRCLEFDVDADVVVARKFEEMRIRLQLLVELLPLSSEVFPSRAGSFLTCTRHSRSGWVRLGLPFVCLDWIWWAVFSYLLKMLDLWVHVLTRVTGRVDCLMCVRPPDSEIKYYVFYVYSCSCIIIVWVILLVSFMQS